MAAYPLIDKWLAGVDPAGPGGGFDKDIVPYLIAIWLDDYAQDFDASNIVETSSSEFSYLFDITAERLLAAWGVSRGRHGGARDASRMRGHPLSAGAHYHRGHAIPHTLGGPTDINLVPQAAKVNVGAFRPLERRAVASPGSFYFSYWSYRGAAPARAGGPGQTPTGVDQGLLIPGQKADIRRHGN
ncbi:DNA/RNA non-specific endonuclease [Methylosinus sp. Ce-a6]|uniref:DNA/RNA non-specific endonuclease n=1 Tax=Methylosinus sp. Ce-a6 TaxID=2172005 RepID=UPI00135CDE46|nr:DNA/RNA non-specific endonuclease [Methylosinus sp. Ce-a6]